LPPSRKVNAIAEKKDRQDTPKEAKDDDAPVPPKKPIPKVAARRPDTSTPNTKSTNPSKTAEKRPRSEEDGLLEVPVKRQRASTLDRPSTPSEQILSSPALSNKSSAQKSQGIYNTPRKDLKAINMIRANSAEGYDSTPGRSGITPSGSKHLDVKPPTSAPLNDKKQAEFQTLSQNSQKRNAMGRSLKHEAQKILTEKGKHLSKSDQKRVAVTSIECILSYIAAYHVQDQSLNLRGRPCEVEATWKTLFPLCMSFVGRTKDLPALDGLRLYLGSVISAAICTHLAHRARTSAKAHDSPQDLSQAPQASQPDPAAANLKLFAENFMNVQRLQQDARIMLPIDDIQKMYPKTWAARETSMKLIKEPEKVSGGNLSGPYFLPIQSDSTPIQAVRFGRRLLSEFCEKERLDYTLRFSLEKPE